DPEAIANWPHTLGRDGARTPIPWRAGAPHSGFSSAPPWLPVDLRHDALAIDAQDADPSSVLNFTRELLRTRRASAALRLGDIRFADAGEVLAFTRRHGDDHRLCAFNLTDAPQALSPDLAAASAQPLIRVGDTTDDTLAPFSGFIAKPA
ncbi:MAG: DUF3459 domain-containing protein, partial [Parvularculaceae bacterium]|nr:DUF3459 domain-containing protein [Parvularculaceae bacterium]